MTEPWRPASREELRQAVNRFGFPRGGKRSGDLNAIEERDRIVKADYSLLSPGVVPEWAVRDLQWCVVLLRQGLNDSGDIRSVANTIERCLTALTAAPVQPERDPYCPKCNRMTRRDGSCPSGCEAAGAVQPLPSALREAFAACGVWIGEMPHGEFPSLPAIITEAKRRYPDREPCECGECAECAECLGIRPDSEVTYAPAAVMAAATVPSPAAECSGPSSDARDCPVHRRDVTAAAEVAGEGAALPRWTPTIGLDRRTVEATQPSPLQRLREEIREQVEAEGAAAEEGYAALQWVLDRIAELETETPVSGDEPTQYESPNRGLKRRAAVSEPAEKPLSPGGNVYAGTQSAVFASRVSAAEDGSPHKDPSCSACGARIDGESVASAIGADDVFCSEHCQRAFEAHRPQGKDPEQPLIDALKRGAKLARQGYGHDWDRAARVIAERGEQIERMRALLQAWIDEQAALRERAEKAEAMVKP